jgi:hypothetical protein
MTDEEEERAAIREYDGGLRRSDAEAIARREAAPAQWRLDLLKLQKLLGISVKEIDPDSIVR